MAELASLPTLEERKKLLGLIEEANATHKSGRRKRRPLEDPFPLRGGTHNLIPAKKFSTLPRKPKKSKMADKPALAPKPGNVKTAPVPKPRKKGPPPIKPVPYHKHKEHKQYDVMTFKSNHPIQQSSEKPTPPQPAEKPPRRYSAKGEPSAQFYKPKKSEHAPIQYTVPSVPVRVLNDLKKDATIDARPRLNTPIKPPHPQSHILSNGTDEDSGATNGLVESNGDNVDDCNVNGQLYHEAYDRVEDENDESEGYAVVSPIRKAAKPKPQLVSRQLPLPPVGPKSPSAHVQSENIWDTVPEELIVKPTESEDIVEGYSVIPPIKSRVSAERLKKSPSPSPSPLAFSAPPLSPQPTGPDEYSVTVHSLPPVPVSPAPHSKPRGSVDQPNFDEYSMLDRPDRVSASPHPSTPNKPREYSPLDIIPTTPPLACNPTQQAGYSQLETSDPGNCEYEVITPEPIRRIVKNPTNEGPEKDVKPKVKARNASQKVKSGTVQLQSARDRSELSANNGADELLTDTAVGKPSPPPKPKRPPLQYDPSPDLNPERNTFSPTLSDEALEKAGYETVHTFSPEPDMEIDEVLNAGAVEDDFSRGVVISPKVEVDIDHIIRVQSALENADNASDTVNRNSYENQAIIDAVKEGEEQLKNDNHPEDLNAGLKLTSPDMFMVPQHAVPGVLGYCELDVLPSDQSPPQSDMIGVVDGDTITVKHNSYPNNEGYCDLSGTSSTPPTARRRLDVSATQDEVYCDIDEQLVTGPINTEDPSKDIEQDVNFDAQGYCDIDIKSSSHTYEVVHRSPKSKHVPKTKPKPKKSASVSLNTDETDAPNNFFEKTASVDVIGKPARRPPRRRAPPPPPLTKAVDDNSLPKKENPSRLVAGDIATLPRGQRLGSAPKITKSSPPKPKRANSSDPSPNNQQMKLVGFKPEKDTTALSPDSPKTVVSSPKVFKRIFGGKKSSGSPEVTKKGWRKKSLRGNREAPDPFVSDVDKTKSLPATGRTHKAFLLPTLDTFEDEESDMYATIADTLKKALPAAAPIVNPEIDTRRPLREDENAAVIESKRRSSFRKKKEKKSPPIRKSNSVEHLYDTADGGGAARPPVSRDQERDARARLPNPDEVPAGLYAMVTSKPSSKDTDNTTLEVEPSVIAKPTENQKTDDSSSNKNPGDSPSKNSLYEREGIVVTSLDEKFGESKQEEMETFVSSADIEHTVSGGSVYAIIQSRPKSKKKKSNVDDIQTQSQQADLQSSADPVPQETVSQPRKPPRSPKALPPKPAPYHPNDESNLSPETPKSPKDAITDLSIPPDRPPPAPPSLDNDPPYVEQPLALSLGSGPPSFPPPPPPKSATPEPGDLDDPTYEIVKKKPPAIKLRKLSLPERQSAPTLSQDKTSGQLKVETTPLRKSLDNSASQGMVLIDDVSVPDMTQGHRPPHLYSTVQEEQDEGPTVAVPMVSHGYATVNNKGKTPTRSSGQPSKKKLTSIPKLSPRTKPPPAPPVDRRRTAPSSNLSSPHQPAGRVASTPLESLSSPQDSLDLGPNKRTLSIDNNGPTESGEPKFLFSHRLCQSLIAVGDSPDPIPSPCPSTNTLVSVDDDSDADIMYSTEWDSSTDDEEQPQTVRRSKTYYIAREVLTTERTFVKGLILLDKDFRQAVRSANNAHDKPVIADDTLKLILGNVSSLLSLNSDMLKDLEERMSKWDEDPRIGDILRIRAPYLKIYTEYISRFDKALKTLDECTKKNPLFAEVVHEFEAQPKCASIPIAGYMLDVVQRITRYKLLISDYVKHLPEDSNDREDSEKALEMISSTATHVNETIRQMDNFRKVVEVRKKLIGDAGDTLITPYRKLLKEGELLKFARKERQPRMFFLFNDILIYASFVPPANTTYKVIKRIPLDGMQVESLDDPDMRYGFQIVSTCKSFRLEASNREEKNQWLSAFESAIKEQTVRMKNREKARLNLVADKLSTDDTDSVPLGHLAPPWLPDSAVSMCQLCSVTFTVTRRRHHCRACGMIFCSDCSSYYVTLKYMNNKTDRVCQSCYGKIHTGSSDDSPEKSPQKRSGRLSRGHNKMVSLPSVLREVKARDQSAQISGYLNAHTSKSKRWKKRWYVVYNLVLYEFERHEDVSAKRSITLPSYQVISPVPRHEDPLVFVLKHAGTGKEYFKVESEEQLEKWIVVLNKAVRGEIEEDQGDEVAAASPEEPLSPQSLDSQEPDSSSS